MHHVALVRSVTHGEMDHERARARMVPPGLAPAVRAAHRGISLARRCSRACRFLEAGLSCVFVPAGGWDTHGQIFSQLRDRLLPELDAALSTLLRDLASRGLLEKTLVVCVGDFGRTSRINAFAGRDHWPAAQSVLLAGAGVRGGQVIGATDRHGAEVIERPVHPEDIVATIRHVMGLATEEVRGDVIRELL
jgi:uncharacterized protein (DUF1501 family)